MSLRYLSINQLNEISGIDRRTIKKRLSDLKVQIGPNKAHLYDVREALPLLIVGQSGGDMDKELQKESLLLERAKREKLEIEVGRLKGQLIPIEEVATVVGKEYSFVRAQMRSIASRLAKPVSMLTEPYDCHQRILEAVDECLTELQADKKYEQLSHELSGEEASGDEAANTSAAAET